MGVCRFLSIALFIHSCRWLCSWWLGFCIEFGWGQIECAAYIVHFSVHMYFSMLFIRNLWFLFKKFWLFGRQVFSLSLTVFSGRIGDLCKTAFVGDILLLGVVCIGSFSLDYFIRFLFIGNFLSLSFCFLKFGRGVSEILANHLVLTGTAFAPEFYIWSLGCFDCLDPPSVQQRHNYSLLYRTLQYFSIQKGYIPFVLHLQLFFLFL